MASVSVGKTAITNAENVCSGAIQDLNKSMEKLKRSYADAGSNGWGDNKYKQLGDIVNGCVDKLQSPIEDLFDCLKKLEEMYKAIEAYEDTNL